MSKSTLASEKKQELQNNLLKLKEEENGILELVKQIVQDVNEEGKAIEELKSKSKFLKKYHSFDQKLTNTLSKLFKIKILLVSNEGSDSEDDQSSEGESSGRHCASTNHKVDLPTESNSTIEAVGTDQKTCTNPVPSPELQQVKKPADHTALSNVIPPMTVKTGTVLSPVYVTEIRSPSHFYIQHDSQIFEDIECKLRDYCSVSEYESMPHVGTYCCVQSNLDDSFYRCQITNIYEDAVECVVADVFCVDNGKTEKAISLARMKPLNVNLLQLPAQALLCSLSQVSSNEQQWSEQETEIFKDLVLTEELCAQFIDLNSPNKIKLHCAKLGLDINTKLCEHIKMMLDYKMDAIIPYAQELEEPNERLCLMMSHLVDTNEIYFHVVRNKSDQIDDVQSDLNAWCIQCKVQCGRVEVGSCWAVQHPADNIWYRVRVIQLLNQQECVVHFVDFGDRLKVKASDLKPLNEQLANIPAFVIQGALWGIYSNEELHVPIIKLLMELIGNDKVLLADVVDIVKDKDTQIKLNLIVHTKIQDEMFCVNSVLLAEGLVCSDIKLSPSDKQDGDEVLDKWNPMEEDYTSEMNTYETDKQDAGVAIQGFSAVDKNLCKNFNNGHCPRGDACHYQHITYDDPRALKMNTNVLMYTEAMKKLKLPVRGTAIAVQLVSCSSPVNFYVTFPYGCLSLQKVHKIGDHVKASTLADINQFNAALTKYCEQNKFHGNKGLLAALGTMVAAKHPQHHVWYRAKIIDLSDDQQQVHVLYVDFGYLGFVHTRDIQDLDCRFIHEPFRAVHCISPSIIPLHDKWSDQAVMDFEALTTNKILVAEVLHHDLEILFVNLYDTTGDTDVNIADALVNMNHAKYIQEKPPMQSSHSEVIIPG